LQQIEKQFGEGSIMPSAAIGPWRFLEFDRQLVARHGTRRPGHPACRIIEVFGPESSGKTTLALHVALRPKRLAASPP